MGILVIMEVELVYEVVECLIIGIIGMNGKIMIIIMIGLLLNVGVDKGVVCLVGNIGYLVSGVV